MYIFISTIWLIVIFKTSLSLVIFYFFFYQLLREWCYYLQFTFFNSLPCLHFCRSLCYAWVHVKCLYLIVLTLLYYVVYFLFFSSNLFYFIVFLWYEFSHSNSLWLIFVWYIILIFNISTYVLHWIWNTWLVENIYLDLAFYSVWESLASV